MDDKFSSLLHRHLTTFNNCKRLSTGPACAVGFKEKIQVEKNWRFFVRLDRHLRQIGYYGNLLRFVSIQDRHSKRWSGGVPLNNCHYSAWDNLNALDIPG